MKNYFQLTVYFVLLFMLYFGFQIHGINTRYLVTAFLVGVCLCYPQYRRRCFAFIQKSSVKYIRSIILYNIITILWTLFLFVGDFSMFVGTFRLVVIAFDMIILWALLPREYRKYQMHLLVSIFILQSFIIFAAFLSPAVLNIIRNFQFDNIMEVTDGYLSSGVFRGLALSGDQFYGLSASFGLLSIFVVKLYLDTSRIVWIGVFLLLFAANMFVGRTGFIGFTAALGYLFISTKNGKIKMIFKISLFVSISIMVIYLLLPPTLKDILDESVFAFAFQLFYNYNDKGSFSTSSSDRLSEMWELDIPLFTLLIGDGRATNPDGSYYGHIDIGYHRQILYGGIVYLFLTIFIFFEILTNYRISLLGRNNKNKNILRKYRYVGISGKTTPQYLYIKKNTKYRIENYKLEIIILLYLLVTHAKGLSIMYCPEIMMIILFYYYDMNNRNLKSIR